MEHDAWFRQEVKKVLDQVDRGKFAAHEEMGLRIEKMFRSEAKIRRSRAAAEDFSGIIEETRRVDR